ncbi:Uu.00g027310.m01.CDS01 [Anthostomella pinea]|uniref:Uu.00g027310.m01.CDS01 n=1 Tax=Anthostomella pinea TaxID=933095 RepID=A0AAI8YCT7_9PEZI|nr:Uu.00g027310.m01.CDS01 [Anthostomella pinea]
MAATILITGATGLVGFRILLAALAAGHNVRYTVRNDPQTVSSNPAVKSLAPSDRLSAVVIPDFTAEGAFDPALDGVTHIIHAGSPVPVPTYDPSPQVYEPTVKIASNLLASALKTPSLQRVVITSSYVVNLGLPVPPTAATYDITPAVPSAATRVPLPSPFPEVFSGVLEAYILAKMVELDNSDKLIQTRSPHFTIAHVIPGYIFGRNEPALDAGMMQAQNSSNNFLMMGMVGGELPFPIHGGFVHLDDVADIHMRVAFPPEPAEAADGIADFGVATPVDYATIFDIVERAFPKAVAAGVFKRGKVPTLSVEYASNVRELLGRELKSFESAVVDVAGQYLEKLGMEKA